MNDEIKIKIGFDERLLRQAMTWPMRHYLWYSAVFAATCLLIVYLSATFLVGKLFPGEASNSAILLISSAAFFGYIIFANLAPNPWTRLMNKCERRFFASFGPLHMTLNENGASVVSQVTRHDFKWSVVSEVFAFKTGTGLLIGATVFPIPDSGLPTDMSGEELRRRIAVWRES